MLAPPPFLGHSPLGGMADDRMWGLFACDVLPKILADWFHVFRGKQHVRGPAPDEREVRIFCDFVDPGRDANPTRSQRIRHQSGDTLFDDGPTASVGFIDLMRHHLDDDDILDHLDQTRAPYDAVIAYLKNRHYHLICAYPHSNDCLKRREIFVVPSNPR